MREGMKMKMRIGMMAMVMVLQMEATSGQQSYVNNHQLNCYNHFNSTDGNVCNGVASSCLSYLTFRSSPPNYNSPVSIAYLLDSDATLIAKANNVSDVDTIPTDRLVIVPVNCSCAGRSYYQHNASYLLKRRSETYFSVANNTYQGLTTCQALMSQNSYGDRNLSVNLDLHIPLRCACPTANQTSVKYLLVYLVTWHDDIPSIAARFSVQPQSLLDANRLSSGDNIYPFTPLLVPLSTDPSQILQPEEPPSPPSPPPPPAPQSVPANSSKSSSNKWVLVGAAALLVVLLLLLLALSAFLLRRRSRKPKPQPLSISDYPNSPLPETTKSSSISWSSSLGVRSAVESLTLYKLEEVQRATDWFSETNKIRGSVYRGRFKGDEAAIKVMKGDVSHEMNVLKRINHSSIIRLSGFCVSGGNTYLVYEYAESGSLSDWLHLHLHPPTKLKLPWKRRVEIAHDVADALNYLHNFAHPPYIHKNLKSSNILLDANLRAKLSNFGLATRTRVDTGLDDDNQAQLHLTRHVVGTQGYMAPEYIESGLVTPKLDVFAFGVIILQLLSGKPASPEQEANYNNNKDNNNNNQREELLSDSIRNVLEGDNVRDKLRDFMDPALRRDYPFDLAFSMAQLAKRCVARDLNSRPEITEAFMTLSKILSSTRDWDPSDELEHSRSMSNGR
uniref:Lysm-containing receptor kinase 10 n=1 Tax=Trema levigatum TaxID=1184763 RepID=A0A221I0X4_9ROSA|nr:lysm-containing receptor kinase 10 [Trema levigatum]